MNKVALLVFLLSVPALAIAESEHDQGGSKNDSGQEESDSVLRSVQPAPSREGTSEYEGLELQNGEVITAPMEPLRAE
jgi:hypothetical protein